MRFVLPTFCHFGEAFSAYTRRPSAVLTQLNVIAAANYHGIRFWDVLGYYDDAWQGREVTPIAFDSQAGRRIPATPDYYLQLDSFLVALQERGLLAHHSRGDLNSWTNPDILAHCQSVGDVQRKVGLPVIGLNEAVNECNLNIADFSVENLRNMLAAIGNPSTIEALSTPPGQTEELADLEAYAHDVWYVHGLRSHDRTAVLRHIFSGGYAGPSQTLGLPGVQGEPEGPGPGVFGVSETNPEMLSLMGALSLISKQWWTYMSSHGVFWDGPIESQPGFYEVARVRQYLPRDIMRGRLLHGGRPEAAFTSPTGFFGDEGVREGPARIDGAELPDGRGAWVVYGGEGRKQVLARRGFEGRVVNTATGFEQAVVLQPGESVEIPFEVGRLLVGRVRAA